MRLPAKKVQAALASGQHYGKMVPEATARGPAMTAIPTKAALRHLRTLLGREAAEPDEQLLVRFLDRRDDEAFAALVGRYGAMVLGVCRRVLRHDHDAEDAFQATFLVLARNAAAVRSRGSLAAWLHGVARRVSLKARAHTARLASVPLADLTVAVTADASWGEVRALLDEELENLPERLRSPLVLCYLEGLTRDEAAARLGCPLGTLKGRLERGRELLRRRLSRRGLALPAVLTGLALYHVAVPPALADSAVANVIAAQVSGRVLSLAAAVGSPSPVKAFRAALLLLLVAGAVAGGAAALGSRAQTPPLPPRAEPVQKPQPKEEAKPLLDALGDPVPDGAVARLGSLRLYHGRNVYRVVLSPDAKLVVSQDDQGENRLWDAVTGQERPLAAGLKRALFFTAKDRLLAAEPVPGGHRLWDVAADKEFPADGIDLAAEQKNAELKGPKGEFPSPDGKLYATRDDKRIRLWDAATRKELPALEEQPEAPAFSISYSADAKLLAAPYTDPTPHVWLWDVATRKVVARLPAKDYQVFSTSFSADGQVLAAADGYGVTLFDLKTGKWLHDFGHTYFVGSLAFTPDGKTLISGAGYTDRIVRLWDPLTGKERGRWTGHTLGVEGLAVSPDGSLVATGSQDQTLRLWDAVTGKEVAQLGDGKESVWTVAFSPDGKTLASGGRAVRLWDVAGRKEVRSLSVKNVMKVTFSPDGKLLATTESGGPLVRMWDVASGREVRQLAVAEKKLSHPAFSPDGTLLAAGDSAGVIHVWEAATGREVRAIGEATKPGPGSGYVLGAVAFSPDGRTLAGGYTDLERSVRLWEVASGLERGRFTGHRSGVTGLAFSPDGSLLASGGWDRTVIVWDVTGRHTARRPADIGDEELRGLWDALAEADGIKAFRAVHSLAAARRAALPLLTERLRPAAAADSKLVARLLKDLDSDDFATRDRASKELLGVGEAAEPLLRKALEGDLSPEARRRVDRLLTQLDPVSNPAVLRGPRAVEALEWMGTVEAAELLKTLAGGDPESRLTREAKAALLRMARGR